MPQTPIYQGRIDCVSILDERGQFDAALGEGLLDETHALAMYRTMVLSRVFDELAVSLQREGRMGTYAENAGQEAAAVGSAAALEADDWIFPSYREVGAYLWRGTPIENLLLFWMGDERAHNHPPGVNNFPLCIPVGTQTLHAAGAAWAFKIRQTRHVAVAYFGDGATSKGDFHEAVNFAGVFKLPVIFFCANNQWAISVPRGGQTASETLAQKALAYGVAGVQVDGNDLYAVYWAMRQAVSRARAGEGATLIEAVTYRLSNHTTADDAGRYRSAEEVETWRRRDPLPRLAAHLRALGWLSDDRERELKAHSRTQVLEAIKRAEGITPPQRADVFAHVFAAMTAPLAEQLANGTVPPAETEGASIAYGDLDGINRQHLIAAAAPGEYLPPEPQEAVNPLERLRRRGESRPVSTTEATPTTNATP